MKEENIIKEYDRESKKKSNDDKKVLKYKESLEQYRDHLHNLRLNYSGILKKLRHPIIVLRTNNELKKVDQISRKLDELLESSLVTHFDEETGDLQDDLENALKYFKPKHIEEFIDENKIEPKKLVKRQR